MYIPFFIFGSIFLLVAFIFGTVWRRSKRITDQGQTTIATVTDITSRGSRIGGAQRGNEKYFHPVFVWTVNGQVYKKEHNAGQDPPKYREGQKVTIFYDPANPAEMTLKGSEKVTKILMISFGSVGGLFLVIGMLIWVV